MRISDRRTFLSAFGAVGLTGCLGPDNRPASSGGLEILETSISTETTDCAGPEAEESTVAVDGTNILLSGVIEAPNPCHDAVLSSTMVDTDRVTVVIDVSSTLEGDEDCVQCHGKVDFTANIMLESVDALETIRVDYESGGEWEFNREDSNTFTQFDG